MNALCGLCIQAFSMSILRSLWSLLTEVATESFFTECGSSGSNTRLQNRRSPWMLNINIKIKIKNEDDETFSWETAERDKSRKFDRNLSDKSRKRHLDGRWEIVARDLQVRTCCLFSFQYDRQSYLLSLVFYLIEKLKVMVKINGCPETLGPDFTNLFQSVYLVKMKKLQFSEQIHGIKVIQISQIFVLYPIPVTVRLVMLF